MSRKESSDLRVTDSMIKVKGEKRSIYIQPKEEIQELHGASKLFLRKKKKEVRKKSREGKRLYMLVSPEI
jgi:hypothetical protein